MSLIEKIGDSILLYQGDCLEEMSKIPDGSINLIVTDPPYRTTVRGNESHTGGMFKKKINQKGMVFSCNNILPEEYAKHFYRVLADGGHCYVMSNQKTLANMLNAFIDCGFKFVRSIIWDKGNKVTGTFYMSQYEHILFFYKVKGIQINNCGTSDILKIPNKKTKGRNGENIHDAEKPVALMEVLVENSSKTGETVLDPFMGSGTTGIACVNTNRRFIGIELDEKYYNLAAQRIFDSLADKNVQIPC